jgi:transposase InsO family protein
VGVDIRANSPPPSRGEQGRPDQLFRRGLGQFWFPVRHRSLCASGLLPSRETQSPDDDFGVVASYADTYLSDDARAATYQQWVHHYNHHRPHTGIGGLTPIDRLRGHNLPVKNT